VLYLPGFTSRAILYQHSPVWCSFAYIAARIAGVDMMELTQSERFVSSMTQEAQALLNQFVLDQQQCPERAWEALAELRGVIGQLQELYPGRFACAICEQAIKAIAARQVASIIAIPCAQDAAAAFKPKSLAQVRVRASNAADRV
jgi:hypothetical protein